MKKSLSYAVALLLAGVAVSFVAGQSSGRKTFTIYFPQGSADLTPEGGVVVQAAADWGKSKNVKSIAVTGYCDTAETNPDALARKRAEAVQAGLRNDGVPETVQIKVSQSRELAVPTPPNTHEPLNRRVEIAFALASGG